jgi:RHS repeat-associated protein
MTDLVRLKYGYDRSSNRLYRRDEVARSQTPAALFDELYGYDGLNRLTSFDRGLLNSGNMGLSSGPTLTQDWTLDPTGNWNGFDQTVVNALTQTRDHNAVNEITDIGETVGDPWKTPAYDANGNMTMLPRPSDLTKGYAGTWDAWNRLVKLQTDDVVPKTVAEYEYDSFNRRTVKKVYDSGGSLAATHHDYFSDQWQTLEERVDASTSADRQFVWGERYVDDLVLRDRSAGGSLNERLYALQDALFSVVALTNTSGAVQERFAYQPYGQSEALNPNFSAYSGTDYEWESRFTGRQLDLDTRLQINRMRYLHLQLGRWVSRDPIGYGNVELNMYIYVGDMPSMAIDPNGEVIWWIVLAIVIVAASGCSSGAGSTCTTCCCVTSLSAPYDISSRDNEPGLRIQQGNEFSIQADLNYVSAGNSGADGEDCVFEWFEWTSNNYGAVNAIPLRTWQEEVEAFPASPTFENLQRHRRDNSECRFATPGDTDTVTFTDRPANVGFRKIDRTSWIGVKVDNAPGCPCNPPTPTRRILVQHLDVARESTLEEKKVFTNPPGPPAGW